MSIRYLEGKTRTSRLYCSDCDADIKKGEDVVFEIDDCETKPMREVYCHDCKKKYEQDVLDSMEHPFDIEE